MSQPSNRKWQKQKARQRTDAKRKYQAQQRRLYVEKFPTFAYQENGAPPEFVKLVKQAIGKIDFRDRQLFSTGETDFYKLSKQYGPVVVQAFLRDTDDNPAARVAFLCKLGQIVFSKIPQETATVDSMPQRADSS